MSTTAYLRAPDDSAARPPTPPAPPSSGAWSTAWVVLVATVLGALLGGLVTFSGPRYAVGSQVLFTSIDAPGRNSPYVQTRFVLDRMDTWAAVVESDVVADAAAARLGEPVERLRGAISAEAPTVATYLDITVEAPDPDEALRWADAVAGATVDTITAQETVVEAVGVPRVRPSVVSVDDAAVDARWLDMRLGLVLGALVGFLVGATVVAVRGRRRWKRQLLPPLDARGEDGELRRIDQQVQIEVLGALLLGQSALGVFIALGAVGAVVAFALTGSALPPLAVVVALLVAGWKDLRFAVGAILLAGVSVLPAKIEVIDLGFITPTVLEVAIAGGVLLTLVHRRRGGPIGLFTGPVLAVFAALAFGSVVGMTNGVSFDEIVSTARQILTLLTYFVVREAFRGRASQLFAILLVFAAAASVLALLSIPLGFELLQSQARDYVITGSDTSDVTRLQSPVLELWSPLLVVAAAGVIRLRPRWLWALVLVPCLALQGLSFNRSTWATLLILAVIVAVLRGGRRGLLVRAGALALVGVIGLLSLQAGLFGTGGEAVAARLNSVITLNAVQEDSLSDRLGENQEAWERLTDSPILGIGVSVPYGGELVSYDDTRDVRVAEPRPWIHQQYLRIWLWMGVAGLLAYGWVGIRILAVAWTDRLRRGRASTITVSGAAGMLAIAGQAVFATSLDDPSVIITIGIVLALIELSCTRQRVDADGVPHHRTTTHDHMGASRHG